MLYVVHVHVVHGHGSAGIVAGQMHGLSGSVQWDLFQRDADSRSNFERVPSGRIEGAKETDESLGFSLISLFHGHKGKS